MAITAATLTSDFSGFITADMADAYFETARRNSVAMQLIPQVPLSFRGSSVPVSTTKPVADWVAEGAKKPATLGAMTLKSITPKKLAAIAVVSDEVVRANPGGYVTDLQADIGEAFAIAFDNAVLHDAGGDGTAGAGPFATFIDQTTKSFELGGVTAANGGVYQELVEAQDEIITQVDLTSRRRYQNTGWAFDTTQETRLRRGIDTTGQPLFTDLPTATEPNSLVTSGTLLGRPSFMSQGVMNDAGTIVGYAGDWKQARWGVVGGISYNVSNQATVTINGSLVSLWEQNLVAIKAEAEYGFLLNDPNAFVKLMNSTGS